MIPSNQNHGVNLGRIAFAAAVIAAAIWAYLPTFQSLIRLWNVDPNYSQGFLIPVLAVGLLWHRLRDNIPPVEPDPILGVGLIAIATVLRAASSYFFITPLDHLSLLILIAGLCLLLAGRRWFARIWPAIAILVFLFPIPTSLGGSNLIASLQTIATTASTFALQTLGVTAVRDGNVILLKNTELGIIEACSGLQMLMVFCALAVVTAFLIPTGWPRKLIVVASAIPLAIFCNVIRITVAGIAGESLGTETGHFIFHDLAGWVLVPMAFLLLGIELYILSRLFKVETAQPPVHQPKPSMTLANKPKDKVG